MHVNIPLPLACETTFLMGEGLLSLLRSVSKMLIILVAHVIFGSNFAYLFQYCPVTGIQNGDKGMPSCILVGQGILMKMLITLEPHCVF